MMYSLLTDGGLRNVLAVHIDVARLASFHAARAGHPDPDWCWAVVRQVALVMQVPLVSFQWSTSRMIPTHKFSSPLSVYLGSSRFNGVHLERYFV